MANPTTALPPIDRAALPPQAQKLLGVDTPLPLRTLAARGVAPGLKPHEALAVVALLAEGEAGPVRDAALATLANPPPALVAGALTPQLDAGVAHALALASAKTPAVMERVLTLPQLHVDTVIEVAARASELVAELIAVNEERLLKFPTIIERLYMNAATRMSTADRILELAVRNKIELVGIPAYAEAAAAIMNELIPEPQTERSLDDELFYETDEIAASFGELDLDTLLTLDEATGEEVVAPQTQPLAEKVERMTVSQKIRKAMLGTASDRALLVRDKNRLVAVAAIKSPKIQETEVARIAASRNVNEDVLRVIATSGEWLSSYQIKLSLVSNPRAPFASVSKFITHLRESDLKALSKSKNVPGTIATAARQQLMRKKT